MSDEKAFAKFTRTILGMDGKHCWHSTGMGDGIRCCQCGAEGRQPDHYERDPMHGPHVDVQIRVLDPIIVYGSNNCVPVAVSPPTPPHP